MSLITDGFEFLTLEEIKDLTGYRVHSKQCDHLRKMGIKFLVNRFGHPKVARAHVRELCCEIPEKEKKRNVDINLNGLMELSKRNAKKKKI